VTVGRPMASADGTITIAIQVQIGATAPMALAVEGQPIPQQHTATPAETAQPPPQPRRFLSEHQKDMRDVDFFNREDRRKMGPGRGPRRTRVYNTALAERDGESDRCPYCLDSGVVCRWHQVRLTPEEQDALLESDEPVLLPGRPREL
jgi:hypothetical protein